MIKSLQKNIMYYLQSKVKQFGLNPLKKLICTVAKMFKEY